MPRGDNSFGDAKAAWDRLSTPGYGPRPVKKKKKKVTSRTGRGSGPGDRYRSPSSGRSVSRNAPSTYMAKRRRRQQGN